MFETIKNYLNESNFEAPEVVLDESIETDFLLEEDQFPEVIDKSAPDEDRDIDMDTTSITDLEYDDDLEDEDLEDEDLEDIEDEDEEDDSHITDLEDIDEDEEEDEIVEDIINEALDNILFSEEDNLDSEIDRLLDEACEACRAKKGKKALAEEEEEVLEEEEDLFDVVEKEGSETLEEEFEFDLGFFTENSDVELEDEEDEEEEDMDDFEDEDLLLDEI